jgi:hypothetical protein
MKEVEIKRFDPLNAGKVMVYMMAIPSALCFLVGLAMVPIGILMHKNETIFMGLFVGIGYPVMFIIGYGLSGVISAYLYNLLSVKYGGLIVQVDAKVINPSELNLPNDCNDP